MESCRRDPTLSTVGTILTAAGFAVAHTFIAVAEAAVAAIVEPAIAVFAVATLAAAHYCIRPILDTTVAASEALARRCAAYAAVAAANAAALLAADGPLAGVAFRGIYGMLLGRLLAPVAVSVC